MPYSQVKTRLTFFRAQRELFTLSEFRIGTIFKMAAICNDFDTRHGDEEERRTQPCSVPVLQKVRYIQNGVISRMRFLFPVFVKKV